MPTSAGTPSDGAIPYTRRHRDGTVWATGWTLDGEPQGHWEWFRVDGTLMRSGSFDSGAQVGEWVTYDKHGAPYKSTVMKRE